MECDRKASDVAVFDRLLRRARIVLAHYRYRGQPVDARRVVEHVLADCADRLENSIQYRAALEEAVGELIHRLR
jgi:hypothetical protein